VHARQKEVTQNATMEETEQTTVKDKARSNKVPPQEGKASRQTEASTDSRGNIQSQQQVAKMGTQEQLQAQNITGNQKSSHNLTTMNGMETVRQASTRTDTAATTSTQAQQTMRTITGHQQASLNQMTVNGMAEERQAGAQTDTATTKMVQGKDNTHESLQAKEKPPKSAIEHHNKKHQWSKLAINQQTSMEEHKII